MIKSKEEYREYFLMDLKMTHIDNLSMLKKWNDPRYFYYKHLRKAEYFTNCRKEFLGKLIAKLYRFIHRKQSYKYGWIIPINVFGKGLCIVHVGTIVVNTDAVIGENCRIHVCTNIGNAIAKGKDGTPVIGNNVYIGPGAKIFGAIRIGDNTVIGANAVVNESYENGNCTIAGVPARVISQKTSSIYISEFGE